MDSIEPLSSRTMRLKTWCLFMVVLRLVDDVKLFFVFTPAYFPATLQRYDILLNPVLPSSLWPCCRLFVGCLPYSIRLNLRSVNGSSTPGDGPPRAYFDCLDQGLRFESKALLQCLERKHLTLRTRIKRLVWKTICFSKTVVVHDTVIELLINQFFSGIRYY